MAVGLGCSAPDLQSLGRSSPGRAVGRVCAPVPFPGQLLAPRSPGGSREPSGTGDESCWDRRVSWADGSGRCREPAICRPAAQLHRLCGAGAGVPGKRARAEAAAASPCALQSSGPCARAIPCGPGHRRRRASPFLAQAGTVCLGQATALASDREASAHLGHSAAVSLIKAAEANYGHMLGTI